MGLRSFLGLLLVFFWNKTAFIFGEERSKLAKLYFIFCRYIVNLKIIGLGLILLNIFLAIVGKSIFPISFCFYAY